MTAEPLPRNESVSVTLTCTECKDRRHQWLPLTVRYGCLECGQDFKARHELETGHVVEMNVRRSTDWRSDVERVEQQPWPRWR